MIKLLYLKRLWHPGWCVMFAPNTSMTNALLWRLLVSFFSSETWFLLILNIDLGKLCLFLLNLLWLFLLFRSSWAASWLQPNAQCYVLASVLNAHLISSDFLSSFLLLYSAPHFLFTPFMPNVSPFCYKHWTLLVHCVPGSPPQYHLRGIYTQRELSGILVCVSTN